MWLAGCSRTASVLLSGSIPECSVAGKCLFSTPRAVDTGRLPIFGLDCHSLYANSLCVGAVMSLVLPMCAAVCGCVWLRQGR